MPKTVTISCMAAGVCLLVAGSVAFGQEYRIKLTRPDKVGDEYVETVTCKSAESIDVTVNGQQQPVKTDKFTAELHGVVTVLSVSEKTGGATKISCKVDRLTKDGAETYPAGTVIIAERTGTKTVFTINGEKADDEKTPVLDAVISLENPDRASTDDEEMGTDKPQKVGAAWPVDAEKVAREITDSGLPVTGDELKGESRLAEVKKINGTEVLVVETTMSGDALKGTLANGATITSGKLSGRQSTLLPTDGTSPAISGSNTMHEVINVTLAGGLGNAVITTDRDLHEERGPVKR